MDEYETARKSGKRIMRGDKAFFEKALEAAANRGIGSGKPRG